MEMYSSMAFWAIPFLALLVDTLIGDPHCRYHPVALIGRIISFYEHIFYYEKDTCSKKFFFGLITVVGVLLTVMAMGSIIIYVAAFFSLWVQIAVNVLLLYICITPRALAGDALEICSCLYRRDIPLARKKLAWIVGRDTDILDEGEITRATVETVAENTMDGIVGPLLFYAFFGPLGALFYRTVNTMDSMLGYRNDRYMYFGRFAARLDDLVNYIPARVTFLFTIISAFMGRYNWRHAWRITLRDAHKHPSPNGGYAEAPIAGALGIRLGGINSYGGVQSFREYMGDPLKPLRAMHIKQTIHIMYMTTLLACLVAAIIHGVVI